MSLKFTDKPKETLYIYCRVSTSGQEKGGSSLDVQSERGVKLSKQLNLKPIVIQEQGSGMKPYIVVRTQFSELMDGIDDGKVKNVWIDEDTRLTRFDVDQQYIHIQMKKNEVQLFVGTSTLPKKWDWITDLVDTLITKVNQNQIKTQVRKSIRSKRKLFSEGCYMKGDPPFGYKLIDRKLEIHELNGEWVKKIYDLYLSGKSTVWIRKELFINQIKPPRGKSDWFPLETIMNILHNKNYIGIDVYGDLTNECPKIIENDIFKSVQKKTKLRGNRNKKTKVDYLLRGLIKCPDGNDMGVIGRKKNGTHPLYTCGHRIRKSQKRKSSDCVIKKSLRSELMDNYVWERLVDTLGQSHTIKEQTKKELLGKDSGYTKRSLNSKIKKLNNEMMKLDDNRLELEKRFYTNKIEKNRYGVLIDSIQDSEKEIINEIQSNRVKLDSMDYKSKWIDWLDVHFSRINEIKNLTDFESRKSMVHHYIQEITILDYNEETRQHTISIKFKFPLFNDNFDWLKNKDGSYKLDKFGRRRFKISEGKREMTNPFTLHRLLNRN